MVKDQSGRKNVISLQDTDAVENMECLIIFFHDQCNIRFFRMSFFFQFTSENMNKGGR